jgi:hypothetical protein
MFGMTKMFECETHPVVVAGCFANFGGVQRHQLRDTWPNAYRFGKMSCVECLTGSGWQCAGSEGNRLRAWNLGPDC